MSRYHLGALIAVVVWGLSFVATKGALRELSPLTLIFTRFGLGCAFLAVVLLARRTPQTARLGQVPWGMLTLLGFLGVFVHQLLQAYALERTSAASTGWLIGVTPLWSAVLAALFLGERFGAGKGAGLLVGFAGVVVIVARSGDAAGGFVPATAGDLMILASTVNWAVYTSLGRSVLQRLDPAPATFRVLLLGWLMLAPLFLASGGWREYASLSWAAWANVAFLGIACSGLGYLLWYGALAHIEATSVAAFLYLEPLVTQAAATWLLGEPLGVPLIAGGLLVLAGVVLVQRAAAHAAP